MDDVNLFNGHISFKVPIVTMGARGEAQATLYTLLEQHWDVTTVTTGAGTSPLYIVSNNWWSPDVSLDVGRVIGRYARVNSNCDGYLNNHSDYASETLSRITFIDSTGTEHELRDAATQGQPLATNQRQVVCIGNTAIDNNRGRVFKGYDGSNTTFLSDVDIVDATLPIPVLGGGSSSSAASDAIFSVSGYLYLPNGSRYRVVNEKITEIRDRHGNLIQITDDGTIRTITDPLGRKVTVGAGSVRINSGTSQERVVTLQYDTLQNLLASGLTTTNFTSCDTATIDQSNKLHMRTLHHLFNGRTTTQTGDFNINLAETYPCYNPTLLSGIILPNGQKYLFGYNEFGEIARVTLPTGGSFEYVYHPVIGSGGATASGVHRMIQKKTTYNRFNAIDSIQYFFGGTVLTTDGNKAPLSLVSHTFVRDSPASSNQTAYDPWDNGKEIGITQLAIPASLDPEQYDQSLTKISAATPLTDSAGKTLFSQTNVWLNGASVPWSSGVNSSLANFPRQVQTLVTQNGLVKSEVYCYDAINNRTDAYAYDYGYTGGQITSHCPAQTGYYRRGHTDYLGSNAVNSLDYQSTSIPVLTGGAPDVSKMIHQKSLPQLEAIYNAAGAIESATAYRYDETTPTSRSSVTGRDSTLTTLGRGNLTSVSRWLNSSTGQPSSAEFIANCPTSASDVSKCGTIRVQSAFDVLGNMVSRTDARSATVSYGFSDSWNSTAGSPPSGLSTFAFPTSTTFPTVDNVTMSVSRTYNYAFGSLDSFTDPNLNVTSVEYNDTLDRPTKVNRPNSSTTAFAYDPNGGWVQTTQDVTSTAKMKTKAFNDGLGRVCESRSISTSAQNWNQAFTRYDALGRMAATSNPIETNSSNGDCVAPASAVWTTSAYDVLGRVLSVTAPDGSVASSAFLASTATGLKALEVTSADAAGVTTTRRNDGFGRLLQVIEDPGAAPRLNYKTSYFYSALDDLKTVCQGSELAADGSQCASSSGTQSRTFVYDTLRRLTSAKNPELCDSSTQYCFPMTYGYDENGNLASKSGPPVNQTSAATAATAPLVASMGYDALNRMTSKSYSDAGTPAVRYCYDGQFAVSGSCASGAGTSLAKGQLTSMGNSVSTTNYPTFDRAGRVLSSTQATGGVNYPFSYGYNLAGSLQTMTLPSSRQISYSFDDHGRVSAISGTYQGAPTQYTSTDPAKAIQYAPHGGLASVTLGNGIVESSTYNNRLQLQQIRAGTLLTLDYTYGAAGSNNGNVQTQTITRDSTPALKQWYQYDGVNRLKLATEKPANTAQLVCPDAGAAWCQQYGYGDGFGNRYVSAHSGAPAEPTLETATGTSWYQWNNRLTSWGYDPAGNVLQVAAMTRSFQYDAESRQTSATVPASTSTYGYDGQGRRVTMVDPECWTVF